MCHLFVVEYGLIFLQQGWASTPWLTFRVGSIVETEASKWEKSFPHPPYVSVYLFGYSSVRSGQSSDPKPSESLTCEMESLPVGPPLVPFYPFLGGGFPY